ncbi:type I restriction endonuclease subunit R [Chitinophaga ginsengisegetis]|uniref:type I restriction endonuclease subunit R n=1 Tax=Chitinophaga ginsengisegetis TaxID=393003 RepID=UPI000DBA1F61|nr:type I restriction endonuclease subunit R [Chitinophaga ginsengisegetis]MDR6571252.1 type I restriction enzyme R subunit [Chitinophaga ginsengisegetis]MDR6650910.1 type I restriction enzyme R subunit [Chitinophaga ginsengisegetis]MDR6657336.1 type I restriction enzyme R subunit [Chitinophaga ginsengisegetis]
MPNFISEDQIEKAIIEVFVNNLGYRHINCQYADTTGRLNERDIVIKPLLKSKLTELNPGLPQKAIDEAFEQLCQTRLDQSELMANKEIFGLIKNGIPVEINNAEGKKEPVTVKVVSFDDDADVKNDYLIVSQLWVQGPYIRRRPDLIVFINGLPLIFIELKNSNIALRNAYDDNLLNYRKDIPLLFHYNAICMLSNGLETKVGSFNAGFEHFFNWLRPENEKQAPDKKRIQQYGVSLDYAVLGLCEKNRLLDYVEHFIMYYNDQVKIAAKNHQFLGVNNAVENFSLRLRHDAAGTDTGNKGKLGVFWHTQGSGKSYSMVFFTRKIFRKFTGNFTFLIVTDRDDLDSQIYRNFLGAGAFGKDIKCRPKNSEDLRGMLQTNTRYIFTLIQKFRFPKGQTYPVLSTRNDIIVIIDEAHRTQYKDLAENMRTGLPNAQYIAFTGTPLLGSKQLTQDWFGKTISEYNFKQSIEDESTVPLYYHKRVPEVLLQNNDIDEDLAEIVSDENLTDEQQAKLEQEFAREMEVIKRDDRLETIARDIVYHFPRRGYLGKGMVISIDKFTAVKMYDKVKRLWEEEKRNLQRQINEAKDVKEKEDNKRILEWMRKADMAVVISEEAGEEEKFKKEALDIKPHRERMLAPDENGQELEDKFKDAKDPLQLVFVCSMWLTGFDAPTVSSLYLDKPMKDHTLMQTIARANRVTDHLIYNKPKKNGLIVDYYNVFRNLKKAFASYGGGKIDSGEGNTEETPVKEKDQLYVLLQDAITACDQWCMPLGVDLSKIAASDIIFSKLSLFDEYADIIVASDEYKKQFAVYDNTIDALYEACKPEILGRRKDFPLAAIIHYLREVLDGRADRGNLDSAKRRISLLLDESIVAQDEPTTTTDGVMGDSPYYIKAWKQIDLSKLNMDKLREEYQQAPYKHIEIADLRSFIADKLQQMISRNTTRVSFAQKLQEIIDRYNSGNATNENYFDDLMDFVQKMKEEEMRAAREGMTEAELELFDLLKKENLTKEEEQKVKLASKNLLHKLKEEKPTVLITDWYKDNQTRFQVLAAIKRVLNDTLPESYDRTIYSTKCDVVFDHFLNMAQRGFA